MPISFLSIPANIKVPGTYAEFDSSKAIQGPRLKTHKVLVVGQRLATGTKPAGQIDIITSEGQARQYYGAGSMLYHMLKAAIRKNKGLNPVYAIAVDDDGAGVKSAGSLDVDVVVASAGTLHVYIGGRKYSVAVAAAQTANSIAAALVAAVNADADRHVDALVNGGDASIADFTYRHKGVVGNDINIRVNYNAGEELPAGVSVVIVAMTGGTTDPSVASVITAMGESQYDEIASAYSGSANNVLFQTELDDRWGPIRQNDGHLFHCRKESFANHLTYLNGRNDKHETVMNVAGPTPTFEWAAVLAVLVAGDAQIDPARPFQTLPMDGILAPAESELFDFGERNQLLLAGGSTYFVDGSAIVRVERLRTTRVQNEFSIDDESLADLNPKVTLSYLRYDFRAMWATKYPRHKLANDGTRFGPGQAVMTPKIGRSEAINKFSEWEELGLVEGFEQFKRDLIVERNASDPSRLDFLLPPDLVNQLRVTGVQIGFLL